LICPGFPIILRKDENLYDVIEEFKSILQESVSRRDGLEGRFAPLVDRLERLATEDGWYAMIG
jgi:hypothetical protein